MVSAGLTAKQVLFKNYLTCEDDSSTLCKASVYGLFADTAGSVWLNTGGILHELDPLSGACKNYTLCPGTEEGLVQEIVHLPLIADRDGNLWGAPAAGLFFFNTRTGTGRFFPGPMVNSLCQDRNGLLWIGTERGLYRCMPDLLINDPFSYPIGQFPVFKQCMVYKDYYGNIFIATREGYYKYLPDRMEYRLISAPGLPDARYNTAKVNAMIADRSEILWLATSEGLFRINKENYRFGLISRSQENGHGLPSDNITAILSDNDRLWIGTAGNGLAVIERNDNSTSVYDTRFDERWRIPGNYLYEVIRDRSGRLWIGTSGGIAFLNERTGTFADICQLYPDIPSGFFRNTSVYRISQDASDNYWLATSRGLYRYNPELKSVLSISNVYTGTDTLAVGQVIALLADNEGMIWFGINPGLVRYDPGQDNYQFFMPAQRIRGKIMTGIIYCLYQDSRGDIWAGTSEGLVEFDREENIFNTYTQYGGLTGNEVFSILEDRNARLWISSGQGITRFDPAGQLFNNFGAHDGIPDNRFNPGAASRMMTVLSFSEGYQE